MFLLPPSSLDPTPSRTLVQTIVPFKVTRSALTALLNNLQPEEAQRCWSLIAGDAIPGEEFGLALVFRSAR